jgi:hypothetical protein
MRKTTEQKWADWEKALLEIMGCILPERVENFPLYQFLIQPTFNLNSCIRIIRDGKTGSCSLTILLESASDIFDAIWKEDAARIEQTGFLAKRRCWEDVVELTEAQALLLQELTLTAKLRRETLEDISLAERDGIGITCWYYTPEIRHTFQMRSPNPSDSPEHYELVTTILNLAKTCFKDEVAQGYFDSLRI